MRTSVLLSCLAIAAAANAQVFTSGFETWNDTLPADWIGSKTNINLDSVNQVSSNVHGGSFAVRLQNSSNSNKRLTTQPLHTDSGTVYNYSFWVRGNAEVHVSMYDGRTAGGGYATYSSYVAVADDNNWTEVTASIICQHTNDATEFIIGCRNTHAPEHLVVDDVNISSGGAPQPVSVHDIQYTTDPNGVSPENGHVLITGGIVTGIDTIGSDAYFIQSGTGPWSGIYVFDGGNHPALGDSVTFQATVQEFHSATELSSVTNFVNVGSYAVPAPQVLNAASLQDEQWEGVLCRINQGNCTAAPGGAPWTVNDGSADQLVGGQMYIFTPTIGTVYNVTGCMLQYDADRTVNPRDANDIEIYNGIAEGVLGSTIAWPNPAVDQLFVKTATTGRVDATLTDALGRTVRTTAFAGNTAINVSDLRTGLYHLTLRQAESVKHIAVLVK